jgi:hypothetical protein
MPVHDWTRVDAGIFHDFHLSWIAEIKRGLNQGLLPPNYYALAEQITGNMVPDVLTLSRQALGPLEGTEAASGGGVAVATAPPKARFHAQKELDQYAGMAKTVVIRHRSGHRIVAMIEIVSPGNTSGQADFAAFVQKAERALRAGVHLLIVDLFPPTARDPDGIHRAIWGEGCEGDFALPRDKPLTCVSYVGYPGAEVYLEPAACGDALPEMPVFLSHDVYVPVPLEDTYSSAWEAVPSIWQESLTAPQPPGNGQGKARRRSS